MSTLREFLADCRKMVEENPDSLDMEMVAVQSASGAVDEVDCAFLRKVSYFDGTECPLDLPRDYPFDSVIEVCIGN